MTPRLSHLELTTMVTHLVRTRGAAEALTELRRLRPSLCSHGYHDTLAVFAVWAVERLVEADVGDTRILWHPLTDLRSAEAWWDAGTLAGTEAHAGFVASTRALPSEPVPFEHRRTTVAA